MAPQVVRPGGEYQVSVTILKARLPVDVTASLKDGKKKVIVQNTTSISSGK